MTNRDNVDWKTVALADAFMGIFGFQRKAIIKGDIIMPEFKLKDEDYDE